MTPFPFAVPRQLVEIVETWRNTPPRTLIDECAAIGFTLPQAFVLLIMLMPPRRGAS